MKQFVKLSISSMKKSGVWFDWASILLDHISVHTQYTGREIPVSEALLVDVVGGWGGGEEVSKEIAENKFITTS